MYHSLGTGRGQSVLQMVAAFEGRLRSALPYRIEPGRPGATSPSAGHDPAKAERGWTGTPAGDLAAMCADGWRWRSRQPQWFAGVGPGLSRIILPLH